ncbi:ABC transporter permease [Microbacterium sp.]|uniref:ABC transporter permease n=1 Tax=Microbacterium sp. TaxID=51671 RepID=UPI0028B07E93|nr:ABC transporter permease [Microbacterium sp.]
MKKLRIDAPVIVLAILVVVLVVGAILTASVGRSFVSAGSIRDILTGMSVLGLVAIGQTLVIIGASLDLSVVYVVSMASLIAATTMDGDPANISYAILLTLAVCAGIGLANGLIVTVLKVNGFIATLGVGLILQGILNTGFKGSAGKVPWEFQLLGATGVGPVPVSTIIMILLAVLIWFLLGRTRTGAHLFAVGGDPEIARLSGVRTRPPLIVAHTLCSLFAGLAGLLLASRLGVGSPTVGQQGGYDLLSIAAVVLGGTLLLGGRGSIWGSIGGVAILAVVDSVMSVMQINPFLKDVVRGVVIIAAVAVYSRRAIIRRRTRFAPDGIRSASDAGARAAEPAMAAAAADLVTETRKGGAR